MELQRLVAEGAYQITRSAAEGAQEIGFDESDVTECVLSLDRRAFYKTMPALRRPDRFQDVYRCRYLGCHLYLKLQISAATQAVVISFKRDEGAPDE